MSNPIVIGRALRDLSGLTVAALVIGVVTGCGTAPPPQMDKPPASNAPSETNGANRIAASCGPSREHPLVKRGTQQTTMVSGHVRDENGAPVSEAQICLLETANSEFVASSVTDASGAFSIDVPRVPRLTISASRADFGNQWTEGTGLGQHGLDGWFGFRRVGPMPDAPVELVLRRGVVLRGRAVDAAGRAFAGDKIMLVPAYVGSGPARIEATTDADGRFVFERAVLARFELVPHSLDYWHPETPGNYLRIAQAPESWLATEQTGGSIEVRVEPYTRPARIRR